MIRWLIGGFIVLLLVGVLSGVFGGRLDLKKTILQRAPGEWSTSAQAEIGSCYAYEYGYKVPVVMEYTPYKRELPFKLKKGQEKPLWLAVRNREMSESLEEASLHITFPPSVSIRNNKPWVCLGTGSNTCYIDFNRSLHPDGSICLDPLFITPNKNGPVDVKYLLPTKNHRVLEGTLRLDVG